MIISQAVTASGGNLRSSIVPIAAALNHIQQRLRFVRYHVLPFTQASARWCQVVPFQNSNAFRFHLAQCLRELGGLQPLVVLPEPAQLHVAATQRQLFQLQRRVALDDGLGREGNVLHARERAFGFNEIHYVLDHADNGHARLFRTVP